MQKQLPLAISVDVDATFDNFYCSDANRLTVTALQQFAVQAIDQSTDHYFYLWGSEACGITHLLDAVQNQAASLSVQYIPLKELFEYSPEDILEGLEQLDLICIDDLQIIAGDKQWEEALFHLFNRLRDNHKQLVIGSHLPPRQLPLTLPDLQSRLQWGLVFQLQALNANEKQQAIQFRAEKMGMQLSDEVASYLLQRTQRSTACLFSLLKQLDHASLAEQRKLTIPFVKKITAL